VGDVEGEAEHAQHKEQRKPSWMGRAAGTFLFLLHDVFFLITRDEVLSREVPAFLRARRLHLYSDIWYILRVPI
jgi:hypothetical protein